ncbi:MULTISPECIES: glycosyltransferase family 2 protein [Hymenobacter]|nr:MULTISPECIES: glycosyltransferase [Hymenobacter]UOQ81425.1 glycosyltransferase [Hymenobacter sp. 5414T-23]
MIPSYNCLGYLKITLENVLQQAPDADKMQIEVVDDYSTDGDVQALVEEIGQGRVHFFRQEQNVGSLRNFETCINRAQGQLVHILHGDDFVAEGFYAEIERLFESFPDAGAAFTDYIYVDEYGNLIQSAKKLLEEPGLLPNWVTTLAQGQCVQFPAMVVKRSVYENLGGFYGVHYGEDWEMWTRIAAHYPVAHSPKALAMYRVHGTNISSNTYLSGQCIRDTSKVIDLIQQYLPMEQRAQLREQCRRNYAIYYAKMANKLYKATKNRKAALKQAYDALRLHANSDTIKLFSKIFIKTLIRY